MGQNVTHSGVIMKARELLRWLKAAPGIAGQFRRSRRASKALHRQAARLQIEKQELEELREQWLRRLSEDTAAPPCEPDGDHTIVKRISDETQQANRNNLTRTAAYLEVYRACPELHWALLAHLVSRNGGWSMTDLKGELLPRLLGKQLRRDIFLFLERANALIFQDAYPQLLLYRESKLHNRSLFGLLPHFHVSVFMAPVWEQFWRDRKPAALTVGLIINEQHYIEGRVVRDPYYRRAVLEHPVFRAQPFMQTNQVLIPYRQEENMVGHRQKEEQKGASNSHTAAYPVAGLTVEQFGSLEERIGVGKALYGMLFGIPTICAGAQAFAAACPHTGSRADYNPRLFTPAEKTSPGIFQERLRGCRWKEGTEPYYSPRLGDAWGDVRLEAIPRYDWFRDLDADEALKAMDALGECQAPSKPDMTGEAFLDLYKLELAVLAAELSQPIEEK